MDKEQDKIIQKLDNNKDKYYKLKSKDENDIEVDIKYKDPIFINTPLGVKPFFNSTEYKIFMNKFSYQN